MKVIDLFNLLKDSDKKIADPIKNVASTYQKLLNSDDVTLIFMNYSDVHGKFIDHFDNNPFTLRNYITAIRDLSKIPEVKTSYVAKFTPDEELSPDDEWEKLMGQIDRDRAIHVKTANSLQRQRRREKEDIHSKTTSNEDDVDVNDSSNLVSGYVEHGKEESDRLCEINKSLESEILELKTQLKDAETRWTEALRLVIKAMAT